MGLSTYSELKASVADWLLRSDLTAVIPDLIRLAEEDFGRELRTREMLVRAVTTPAADEPYENLPGDFLELKAIQFNSNPITVPDYRTPAWLRAYRRHSQNDGGTPCFYTIEGPQFLFDVTPSDVELEILYYQTIPALSDSNTTNWLLTAHPSLYLYGSLVQSAPYLKDDERVAIWDTLYQRAKAAVQKQDQAGEVNGPPIKVSARRSLG
jgi:hypothetical protein